MFQPAAEQEPKTFPLGISSSGGSDKKSFGKRSFHQVGIDAIVWTIMTIYFVPMTVLGHGKEGFELACVVYAFISLRLLAKHVSMSKCIYEPIGKIYSAIGRRLSFIPPGYITPILFAITTACLLLTAICSPTGPSSSILSRLQSCFGIFLIIIFMFATSHDRRAIPWYTVASGLLLQYVIAMFVLKSTVGQNIFYFLSTFIAHFLGFSETGLAFIIGLPLPANFATSVFPAIIFFCSFISIVYYFGGLQYLVGKLAWIFLVLMDTSGAESAVACASPFVGQGESALLVGPFVQYMTKSELHSTMVSGFATIAGSVFVFYITLVRDPSTILCCCVMSIPAGLLLSKMRYPEMEESISKGVVNIPEREEKEVNFLHAACNGAGTGVHLVLLIAGSLLCIISLYAAADSLVGWLFAMVDIYDWTVEGGGKQVSIELLSSYLFMIPALVVGISFDEARVAGTLMATKMMENEFVAYDKLHKLTGFVSDRTLDLMAFALCGFANFSSIGIQIGALGAIAPSRTKDLAQLAFSAMLTGTCATWLCACMAGVIL